MSNHRLYKSFIGHLEGTQKAHHTIRSYQTDLKTFESFIKNKLGHGESIELSRLNRKDLDSYGEYLRTLGLKTNSRRRKLVTLRKLLRYLKRRKKIHFDIDQQILTPSKVERIPQILSIPAFREAVLKLTEVRGVELRNKTLLLTLVETGCRVSDLCRIRASDWDFESQTLFLSAQGKTQARRLKVSIELLNLIKKLSHPVSKTSSDKTFTGFPGSQGSIGITDRAIELIVALYSHRIELPELKTLKLTPRLIRHSVVAAWFQEGVSNNQIKNRLGLLSEYAFRVYLPISNSKTTSES